MDECDVFSLFVFDLKNPSISPKRYVFCPLPCPLSSIYSNLSLQHSFNTSGGVKAPLCFGRCVGAVYHPCDMLLGGIGFGFHWFRVKMGFGFGCSFVAIAKVANWGDGDVTCKRNDLSEKPLFSVLIYNQQCRGTILLIVFDLECFTCFLSPFPLGEHRR